MTDGEWKDDLVDSRRRHRCLHDILLVGGVVFGGGLLYFLCIIGYVAGLRNDRGMISTVPCVFVLTFGLVAIFCLISSTSPGWAVKLTGWVLVLRPGAAGLIWGLHGGADR